MTFNALVTALGTGRQWRLALSVLSAAALRQVRPGTVTYNAAIAAMEPWRRRLEPLEREPQLRLWDFGWVRSVQAFV